MTREETNRFTFNRVALCALGIFCVSFGIAVTSIADLGTSPISSVAWVAYRVSQVSSSIPAVTFGTTTFVLNAIFFLTQWIIQGRDFGRVQFLQIPSLFVFSAMIDLSMKVCALVPISWYPGRLAQVGLGCAIIALGLACEFAADVLYLPGDGMVRVLTPLVKLKVGATKIAFDVFLVVASIAVSYAAIGRVVGVREGTLISMFAVGFFLKLYQPLIEKLRRLVR